MKTIVVTDQYPNGTREPAEDRCRFKARVEGFEGRWAVGSSRRAAVGDLVMSHPEAFGVKVTAK